MKHFTILGFPVIPRELWYSSMEILTSIRITGMKVQVQDYIGIDYH
jgi:hypothetical protein